MTFFSRMSFIAAVLVIITAGTFVAQVQVQGPHAPISDEYLLLGSANRGAGEPIIFANPRDPQNLIVAAMATLNRLPSGEPPITPRGTPEATLLRVKELSTPDGSRTDIAVTTDGGKTWTFTEDNFRQVFNMNRCSDSFAGAGPDGTLYVGCLAYLTRGTADFDQGYAPNGEPRNMRGGSAMAWSTDKGRTWSRPVWVHPAQTPEVYAPGVNPVFEQASPWDRPFFAADASNNTIYVTGTGPTYTVDPKTVQRPAVNPNVPGMGYTGYPPQTVARTRTFIRASRDQGRTWELIRPMDSEQYPGGRGGMAAAHGRLVVAYNATQVPASDNAQCPCTVLGFSTDRGATYNYRVVPPLPKAASPAPVPAPAAPGRGGRGGGGGGVAGGIMLSADPSAEGRYAIARQAGRTMMVSVTDDGGRSWRPPVLAAELPGGATAFGHRAMKYSTRGDLALIWKSSYANGSFDVWSAASRDGGRTFRTIRISHAVSPPYIVERGNFMFGDDLSSIEVDDQFVHAVWGDNRSGFLGTWYGRVPLMTY
jgi:hypothetical protein